MDTSSSSLPNQPYPHLQDPVSARREHFLSFAQTVRKIDTLLMGNSALRSPANPATLRLIAWQSRRNLLEKALSCSFQSALTAHWRTNWKSPFSNPLAPERRPFTSI